MLANPSEITIPYGRISRPGTKTGEPERYIPIYTFWFFISLFLMCQDNSLTASLAK